jgi:small multidrug resistance pump
MAWVYLMLAIVSEVAGTTSMKLSEGFTKPVWSVGILVFYGASLYLLTLTLKTMDVSLSYAIWAGLGTALIAAIGVLWFGEPLTALKVASLALIVAGVVGLNLGGAH